METSNSLIKVFFLQSPTPAKKIDWIVSVARKHLENKRPLAFLTENTAARAYLDDLLWKYPKDSFLPHTAEAPSEKDLIFLSLNEPIPDHIHSFFNLTSSPYTPSSSAGKLYEIEESHIPEKKKFFEKKFHYYTKAKYHIISL